jgi:hypothetical protein
MSGSATDYLETQVLQHTLGILAMPMPATLYLVLCTTVPSDATPGTEVTGGGYVRMHATYGLVAGRTDAAANLLTIEFPAATTAWGTVGWLEVWDAASAGNRQYWGPLVDPTDLVTPITRAVQAGDIMRIPAGTHVITAD